MRVWVTRAQPAAKATAERLRGLGHVPVVAPLIVVRPIADARIDLGGVAALAFTSANAVAAFASLSPERALPVYAVGAATAAAARGAGFSRVGVSDGDVAALARAIAAAPPRGGAVLHPGAAEPAGDLVGALAAAAVPARAVAVYTTEAVSALPLDLAEPWPDTVLVQSPKAARALARLLPPDAARRMLAVCLSSACAEPLRGLPLRRVEVADAPNEAALLALLSE